MIIETVHSHSLLRHSTLQCVFGGLIMIRERNYRTTNTKKHRRMNLTMSIVKMTVNKICQIHCYKSTFLFLHIKILNKSSFSQLFKIHVFSNIICSNLKLIVLNSEQRTHTTAWVSVYLDLILYNISNNRYLFWNMIILTSSF